MPSNPLRLDRTEGIHLVVLLLLIVPLFAWAGQWGTQANADTLAVSIPAWRFSSTGSIDLTEVSSLVENQESLDRWYVFDRRERLVSNRAPGLIALAIPAYSIAQLDTFSNAPGTTVAFLLTTLALVLLWFAFKRLVPLSFATGSVIVLALGTTTWTVSAAELWPHGPGQLWAAITVLAMSSGAHFVAGLAMGLSITTRLVTAVTAATLGIAEAVRLRSVRPALKVAAGSIGGLALVLFYNNRLFGGWSLRGGYSEDFTTGAARGFDLLDYLTNVFDMFVGLPNGFLVVTPIIGVAAFGAWHYRAHLEPWMYSLVAAALAYLLVHAALNRASGGAPVFYRYPLESIALVSPVLVVGAYRLWSGSRKGGLVVVGAAALSIALLTMDLTIFKCGYTDPVVHTCLL